MSEIDTLKELPEVSFIDDMTLEQCLQQMKGWWEEEYEKLTGERLALSSLDMEKLLLDTCGLMYYQALRYIDYAGKQNLLKYAAGDFLENKVADMRVFRGGGQKARTVIRFQLSEARGAVYTIPAGTLCATEDGTYFGTLENAEIPAGEMYVDAECECTEAGTDGNEYGIGEINTLVSPIAYLQNVSNVSASYGGTDPEEDDVLAEKRFLAPAKLNGWGGDPYYKAHVRDFDSNIGDIVTHSPQPCYADITFVMKDGSLPSAEEIAGVQDYLNDKCVREVGDIVTVRSPETAVFSIDIEYFINESDRKNSLAIQEAVEQAVLRYKDWQCSKFGRDINPGKLYYFIMEAGAKRCDIHSPVFTDVPDTVIPVIENRDVFYGGIEDD